LKNICGGSPRLFDISSRGNPEPELPRGAHLSQLTRQGAEYPAPLPFVGSLS
jgi:hypothetical protein